MPLAADAPALGPGKIRNWLIAGRLPNPGTREVLVERHYGAFFQLNPGSSVGIGGEQYAVTGVVDIQEGSQIVASNFYMDIDVARRLADLPPDLVNQVFLKLSDMAQTERVKNRIAAWMPHASVTSPGTMLQLFGGVSQTIGRFRLGRGARRRDGRAGARRHLHFRQSGRAPPRARHLARDRLGADARCGARSRRKWRCKGWAPLLALGLVAIGGDLLAPYQHHVAGEPAGRKPGELCPGRI